MKYFLRIISAWIFVICGSYNLVYAANDSFHVTCNCYNNDGGINKIYKDYLISLKNLRYDTIGGYSNYSWEKPYRGDVHLLNSQLVSRPISFSYFHKNLVLHDQMTSVIKDYKIHYYCNHAHLDYPIRTEKHRVWIHEDSQTCHQAFQDAYLQLQVVSLCCLSTV